MPYVGDEIDCRTGGAPDQVCARRMGALPAITGPPFLGVLTIG